MSFKSIKAWFNVQSDLDTAIDELGNESTQLKKQVAKLEQDLAHYKILHDLNTNRSQSIDSFSFDFSAVRVFSVERAMREGELTTIISWLNSDETTHEWYYGCNQHAHEELVQQFKKYKGM